MSVRLIVKDFMEIMAFLKENRPVEYRILCERLAKKSF